MDPNGDAMVMCIDAIKKPMSFNDQKPTTFFFHVFSPDFFFLKRHIGQTSEVWQTEAMYLNLSVEGDAFWEAHERDYPSTHKTTKRQNDTHFLIFFTGSQPRGEVSLKFLTEEVMFFSYQHFDVRFLLTIWSVDLVAWIIWIVESLNKQDKPKKIQQLSSLNDFKGSRC